MSLNLLVFLIYPDLLGGFLNVNLTGEDTVLINHSFGLTKLIQNFFIIIGFLQSQLLSFQLPFFLIILITVGGIGFILYLIRRYNNFYLIYGYSFGILIMLICYYDSWDHHLLILTPLLLIILFNLPRQSEITKKFIKPIFLFLSFLDLAFMGLYFVVMNISPFNFASTIFLILVFYGLIKYINLKNSIDKLN